MLSIIALRLVPLVPFNVLNYLAGASAIRTRDYVAGTAIGIIPGAIAFATLGGSIDDPGRPAFIAAARARRRADAHGCDSRRAGARRRGAAEAVAWPRSCAGWPGPRRSCSLSSGRCSRRACTTDRTERREPHAL